jgi:hypothetical protein
MTVYIEQPAINLREELADLRNQGTYQEQQFWYENLVTNGTFDTATTGWTAGPTTTLSIASNRLRVTNVGTVYGYAYQSFPTLIGKTYTVSVDITFNAGVARLLISTSPAATVGGNISVSASGSYSHTFVATTATTFVNVGNRNDTDAYNEFDNISVYESDGTDIVHRLPKGWKPKDVFEDGSLQREGAAYDYDVVYDGFDYFVKPAVAPGAATQTCVIGVKA